MTCGQTELTPMNVEIASITIKQTYRIQNQTDGRMENQMNEWMNE